MSDKPLSVLAADTIRVLSAEAVHNAKSGHQGLPMGMADASVTLWKEYLNHNPANANWANRDRFILSAGHGSMLIYSLLHLTGYDLSMDDIRDFRQWHSKTPGHPENFETVGVETTTGPLGQGISNSVGFALAEAWLASQFNEPNYPVVDHFTYVIASDGDLQEGVSHEAASLAGHLGLGKLVVLYDDNGIQIDGPTSLTFSEDIPLRFAAYGWHTQTIDGHDQAAVAAAIANAKAVTDRPSIISCKTTIGIGGPVADTSKAHGYNLKDDGIGVLKQALGWEHDPFTVPQDVYTYMNALGDGKEAEGAWNTLFADYQAAYPEKAAQFVAQMNGDLPTNWEDALPAFGLDQKMATRAASGKVLASLVPVIPAMLGGSADLSGSNKTDVKGTGHVQKGDISGRYVYYGVREHGMGAIMNGLALHGGVIPYSGTFLVFSDYMRGSVRLSALMQQQVIYVYSHDSIGLGEDGPTHQPVEHMLALRAIPNLMALRPADPNEVAAAWKVALNRKDAPTAIALTRQGVPTLPSNPNMDKGGYVVAGSDDDAVVIIATGSEVGLALTAREQLAEKGIAARVVSMMGWKLFDSQSDEYRESVLPAGLTARVSVEAGVTMGWSKYVGDKGLSIGIDHFGASAPYQVLYEKFGITAEAVAAAAESLV
ncbi:MAG: transketolase [Candidatus Promineifilaceae bacterium]